MRAIPPRVLLHAFSTFKLGGPQGRFIELANAMGDRYRHLIVAMDGCFDAGDRLSSNVDWEPLHVMNLRGGGLANRKAFRQLLKTLRPDLLITYNWGAVEWAAANLPSVVPHVHVEDGFGPEEVSHQLPRRVWTRRLLLGIWGRPLIVPSLTLQRIALDQWRFSRRRVQYIPNGVLIPAPNPLLAARAVGNELIVIGTVAGLRREKNLQRLIKAFAAATQAHSNLRLMIVGGGPELANLQSLADELQIANQVEFTGYLAKPQEAMLHFDLFALSSDTEQLPISMLEAMASSIPVVATDVGDVGDILRPISSALVCAPEDATFAHCLLQALDNRSEWAQWSAAGLEIVQNNYHLDKMLQRWQTLFDGHWLSDKAEISA